jgi:hypothetical protein
MTMVTGAWHVADVLACTSGEKQLCKLWHGLAGSGQLVSDMHDGWATLQISHLQSLLYTHSLAVHASHQACSYYDVL